MIILERAVVFFGRDSARQCTAGRVRQPAARVGSLNRRRTEISHFKLHRDAASLGIVFEHLADELQVVRERCGKLADILLLHPAVEHLFLERNEYAFIRIAPGLTLVVKRPHE